MAAQTKKIEPKKEIFSVLLMFVFGFAGFSILGTIILVVLISLGILPQI